MSQVKIDAVPFEDKHCLNFLDKSIEDLERAAAALKDFREHYVSLRQYLTGDENVQG